jgi:hypothetical protein
MVRLRPVRIFSIALLWLAAFSTLLSGQPNVLREHPRLLGTRVELQALAKARPQEYQRMLAVARGTSGDDHPRGISLALAAAIEGNADFARAAHTIAMRYVNGPIRKGHVTFGYDLALCGLIYDLCFEAWTAQDRAKFHDYFNKTVDANVNSETHVFHDGWYAYKNWGIGIAAYATFHENPRSPEILATLDRDYRTRAAPALEMAGAGGGWAEGYYIHYWLYEWLFFCEVARRCGGVDYYELAPSFFKNRALASAFEMYPGFGEYNSRRPIPMGDGGGRKYGGDRDKALSARRMLVNRYRDDATHQALHAFNELTPRSGSGVNAYKDFLWRDTSIPKRPVEILPLSHHATGPGFIYARSSWEENATHLFFKAGDRFTAHQHLDNGHFLIYRGAELAGDGGHYDGFGTPHDVNYHLRSIAHSTVLVQDPAEKWPAIRGGKVTGNDGGQHHRWPHHNGAVTDPQEWLANKALYDIADVTAFRDDGKRLFLRADLTRAYSSNKLSKFVRQIAFLRPGTFVICDEVISTRPEFRKTWLLQAMKTPEKEGEHYVVKNGRGALWFQPLLPAQHKVELVTGEALYRYGGQSGQSYPPKNDTGAAPECRVELRPVTAQLKDVFVSVLTAAEATQAASSTASAEHRDSRVRVACDGWEVSFELSL